MRSCVPLALLLIACAPPSTGKDPSPAAVSDREGGVDEAGTIRYLALGDSLSQGIGASDPETGSFPALLAKRWRAKGCKVEVKNLGVAGFTAAQVVAEQLPEIAAFRPSFVTFEAGSNDIATGVTLDAYRGDVQKVLAATKKSGARVVVLPQNEWFRSPEGPSYGSGLADKRASFDVALIEEATAHGAELADLRLLFKQQADRKQWYSDGIHPTGPAYEAWAEELARVIPAPCRS